MITCDICKQTGKRRYRTKLIDGQPITMCDDCRYGRGLPKNYKSKEQIFNELQTPFWKMMGAKPKPRDIVLENYLKRRNMSYGDWRRERDFKEQAKYESALPQFEAHVKKYGTGNSPAIPFNKAR